MKCFVYFQAEINIKYQNDACMIKEFVRDEAIRTPEMINELMAEEFSTAVESRLSTRLPDETYRAILNFGKTTIPDTSIDQIEKALVS